MTVQLFKIHIPVKDRQKEKRLSFCNTDIILLDPDKLKRTTQAKDWPFLPFGSSWDTKFSSLRTFAQEAPILFFKLIFIIRQGRWAFKSRSFFNYSYYWLFNNGTLSKMGYKDALGRSIKKFEYVVNINL